MIFTLCLICLPFIESIHGATLWGLNFESPTFMANVRYWLFYFKYLSVFIGFCIALYSLEQFEELVKSSFGGKSIWGLALLLSGLQMFVMFFGVMLNSDSLHRLDKVHRQKAFEDSTIYVYTADPGAMGRAYHYFYQMCDLPLNRYELNLIIKTAWLGNTFDFSLSKDGNTLRITDAEGKIREASLAKLSSCN
ncbi:hypothetical protein [Thalassotalea loyana]|uniref:hypothetical protein n=1 Tax=Thalassotalea loyana TaxID=280483 RepID=UPI0024E0DEED|nr:hypothetical protein [Thalassotalea loyana]